jgi:hypothetical protein
MAASPLINALVHKRGMLAGELERHQATVRQLMIDLDNIDGTLRLFDPAVDASRIKPKPLPPFMGADKGQVARIILGTLRTAKRPFSTVELARHVMVERGLNTTDKGLVELMTERVGSDLRYLRQRGSIKSIKKAGQYVLWCLPAANNLSTGATQDV